ncbi:MAG: hypothetical protein OXC28_15080 [Defluviicoccus sp.]|nr:hypothetical protein [Defluviicoccus sp.]
MALSERLTRLIEVSAPLWAGEAEVVRTYWDSPVRNHDSELLWLRRQCSKEFNGTGIGEYRNLGVFMGPITELGEIFTRIDTGEGGVDRRYALELIEILHDEFDHYARFADIYDAIRAPGTPPMNPHELETWDEDAELTRTRHRHNAEHGALGVRASRFTEGGYCTLFREGMRLKGRGGTDDMIAEACTKVFEDEFGHMLEGIIGLDDEGWSEEQFDLLEALVLEQLRLRIPMRNAEFSFPLSEDRVRAIYAGDIEPEKFDYGRAESVMA